MKPNRESKKVKEMEGVIQPISPQGLAQQIVDDHLLQMGNLAPVSTISEYDMGGEGDLFKAPESIFEEPLFELEAMAAGISMMSAVDDVSVGLTASQTMKVDDIADIQNEELLNEMFYEYEKGLLAQTAMAEAIDKIPMAEHPATERNTPVAEGPLQKSVSSGNVLKGSTMRPEVTKFQELDLDSDSGMRRAYSEGDIQTLGTNTFYLGGIVGYGLPSAIGNLKIEDRIEERRQKLSRYRKKKSQRKFGRRLKYACRKALADSQPRVRGRFARTEDMEPAKLIK